MLAVIYPFSAILNGTPCDLPHTILPTNGCGWRTRDVDLCSPGSPPTHLVERLLRTYGVHNYCNDAEYVCVGREVICL